MDQDLAKTVCTPWMFCEAEVNNIFATKKSWYELSWPKFLTRAYKWNLFID